MELVGATVSCDFYKSFVIADDKLSSIVKIIRQRFPDEEIEYRVVRKDLFVYQAKNLDEVLSDENRITSRINVLTLRVDSEKLNLYLTFRRGESSSLSVEGPDRDLIFLLYDELRKFLTFEVFARTKFKGFFGFKLLPTIAFGALCVLMLYTTFLPAKTKTDQETLVRLIGSEDISGKLDFLLERHLLTESPDMITLGMLIVVGAYILIVLILWSIFSPNSIFALPDTFLIGQEINYHNKRVKRRSNIFWGIIIATIISVGSGIIVFFLTS